MRMLTLLLAILGFLPAAMLRAEELPPDLAAVPAKALGFIHVRVAELWKGDAAKDLRTIVEKIDPKYLRMLDERFEPAPSTVERLTLILMTNAERPDPSALVVVTTNVPFDRDKLLTQSLPNAEEVKSGDAAYYFDEKLNVAVQIVSDRVLVFGPNETMKEYTARKDKGNGVFAAALHDAAGKPVISAAVNAELLPKDLMAQLPPALQPALKGGLIYVGLESGKSPTLAVRLHYPDAQTAGEAEKAVTEGRRMARQALAEYRHDAERTLTTPNTESRSSLQDLPEAAASLAALSAINQLDEILQK